MTIEQRLDQLERRNRRLTAAGASLCRANARSCCRPVAAQSRDGQRIADLYASTAALGQ